jgi:hypothetical protein
MKNRKLISSEKGILTLDLMFALVLVAAFSMVLFAMMFTLSLTSVAQYISFTSARSFSLAHFSQADQEEAASQKFRSLMENEVLAPVMEGPLFRITEFEPGDFNEEYEPTNPNARVFWGVRLEILSNMLSFRVPIFGSTDSDRGFRAWVNSYLMREPTENECREGFFADRYETILNRVGANTGLNPQAVLTGMVFDNGC